MLFLFFKIFLIDVWQEFLYECLCRDKLEVQVSSSFIYAYYLNIFVSRNSLIICVSSHYICLKKSHLGFMFKCKPSENILKTLTFTKIRACIHI